MQTPNLTRPRRAALALLAGAALTCGAGAASADAATYCVAKPDCPGGTPVLGLDAALKLAATSVYTSDTIALGPVTFASDTGFHYYAGGSHPANDVQIQGSPGTVLSAKSATATDFMTVLSVEGAGDSVVSGLDVRVPAAAAQFATGLRLQDAAAEDVSVSPMPGMGTSVAAGIELRDGADLRASSVDLAPLDDGTALALGGSPHAVEDVELSGGGVGLAVGGQGATAKVSRARIDARGPSDYGVSCNGCELELDDSLIQLDGTDTGIAVKPNGVVDAGVHASHVTVAALSPASAVEASTTVGGDAEVWIDNCILATSGSALTASSIGIASGAATIAARNCNYAAGKTSTQGKGTIDAQAITHLTTGFAGSWNADYRLHWSSPLIDAGRTAGLYVSSPFTLDGLARSVDGNVDGAAVPDLGAFEYQAKRPVAKLLGPSVAKAGIPVTFDASASYDGDPNEPVRYEWALPGGAKATTPSVKIALPAGKQVVSLTVVDPKGKQASVSRTVDVAPAPPPIAVTAPPPVAAPAAPLLSEVRVVRKGRRARVHFVLARAAALQVQLRRRADGRWRRVTTVRVELEPGDWGRRLPRLRRASRYRVAVTATAADGATANATAAFRTA